MKVLGIIAEYNPFHNGHLYHLNNSRELTSADSIICVMSGNFVQRGEPAVINKWARAEAALANGVDLVLELPVVYAMASAEFFAWGAVRILDSLGIVDCLCFGSESGSIGLLDKAAEVLLNEPQAYRELLKKHLGEGASFPAAREAALSGYFKLMESIRDELGETMGYSNNILGIEYLKAIKRLKSPITPVTIKRIANNYNTVHLTGALSSATSIRRHLSCFSSADSLQVLEETLPPASLSVLQRELEAGRGPVFPWSFEKIILSLIRLMSREQLAALPYVSEGLENRIKEAAEASGSLEELLERTGTKRYTRTRIQRSLFSLLSGLDKNEFEAFNRLGGPQYIRVLGFNNKGRQLLSAIKSSSSLPMVVKAADCKNSCNPFFRQMMEIEARSTDIYVLGYPNSSFRASGQEFTQNLIRL